MNGKYLCNRQKLAFRVAQLPANVVACVMFAIRVFNQECVHEEGGSYTPAITATQIWASMKESKPWCLCLGAGIRVEISPDQLIIGEEAHLQKALALARDS
jgi:hypothetical protein